MKRNASAASVKAAPKTKKPRVEVPEYHLTPSLRNESGEAIWPAPKDQIEKARDMIREWYVPQENKSQENMFSDTIIVRWLGRKL